jgi:PAS domain-containing protein
MTDRFRLLVDAVQDYGIFMLDPTGNVMSWNTGAQRLKQYTADEIIGRNFSTFYPPRPSPPDGPPKNCGAPRRTAALRKKAGASARTAAASGPTS